MKSPTFDLGFRLTVDIDTIPLLTLSPGFKANYSFTGLSDAMSKYSKDLKNSSSCQSYSCLFTTTSGSATAQFGLWLKAHLLPPNLTGRFRGMLAGYLGGIEHHIFYW